MDELMDMIVSDESPSQISDKLKDMLYAKSAEKIDGHKSSIASSLFGDSEEESEIEASSEDEVDEVETDEEQ